MKRLLLLPLFLVLGCKNNATAPSSDAADETAAVGQGTDAVQITNDEAASLEMTLDGSEGAAPLNAVGRAEQVAAYMAGRVAMGLQPPSCFASSIEGATVTYTFNDCTNARGAAHLTGTITAVYSVDAAGTHVHATATNFTVNESTLNLDATATYSVSAGVKTIVANTQSEGTGPLGNTIARSGSYTVSWSNSCHTLNGTWNSTSNGLTRSTTVSNLTRCRGYCPQAGGTVTHVFRNGRVLTITYNGASANWTDGTLSGTIRLMCTPAP